MKTLRPYTNEQEAPVAKGLPFIGQSLKVAKDPLGLLKEFRMQYADVVKVRLGLKDFYLLQTPEAARHVLQENARNYYKPGTAKLMKRVLGDGLATSNGDLWLRQRRLIQPAFHRNRLNNFFNILQTGIPSLINEWKEQNGIVPIEVSQAFLQLTLNNLTKTMFGAGVENRMDEIGQVLRTMLDFSSENARSIIKMPLAFPTKKNLCFKNAEQQFEKIIYEFIDQRKNEKQLSSNAEHDDLLELLLSAYDDVSRTSMTETQLRDEITTIFMAGHETTSQTLSWICYRLALQPELCREVKKEVQKFVTHDLTHESLSQLVYAKSLIEETMRFYPPVWIMARKAITADNICGFRIPQGATILINVYGMNHHPEYWNDPDTFDPSRFSKERKEKLPPFLYLPFGGGQRLCIGNHFAMMVMQTIIARLVESFEFSLPNDFKPVLDPNLTLRAKGGIQLTVKQINVYAEHKSPSRLC